MAKADLNAFVESASIMVSQIFLPTERIALEYGVSDLEEAEYGALEVAREYAEKAERSLIVAYEFSEELIAKGREIDTGVLTGNFGLISADMVAFYLITNSEEELEWYDATEAEICLAKAKR